MFSRLLEDSMLLLFDSNHFIEETTFENIESLNFDSSNDDWNEFQDNKEPFLLEISEIVEPEPK